MKAWWRTLSSKDQRIAMIIILAALGFVVWVSVWRPLTAAQTEWSLRADRAQSELQWMHQAQQELSRLRGSAQPTRSRGSQSLLSLAEQTATSAGLGNALRRGEPSGEDALQMWFEDAPFDGLMRWLEQLQSDYTIVVEDASLDRSSQPGLVDVRLALKDI